MILARPWLPDIMLFLSRGPANYNQILTGLEMSDPTLTRKLRELSALRLVHRLVDVGPPIRVTYILTAAGQRFEPAFRAWASEEARLSNGGGPQPDVYSPPAPPSGYISK